jgi:4-hydroxy-tetrahydrodipicolinate synthase
MTTTEVARIAKADRKDWARERFRGGENSLLPSYTPDLESLDEEGVRHDVRTSIRHGFFSMFCAGVGLRDAAERRRFLEIAVDEAQGQILVSSGGGGGSSIEAAIANLRELETIGLSHVMFSLPSGPELQTADAIFEYSRRIIESTNLGIVLYAQSGERFRRFHPGNVPLDIFERLAELPNVVGAKITQVLDPVMTYECCERLGDKLLLGPVNLELAPFMARLCPIQYTAMWQVEACQSPEKPYVNDYLRLLSEQRFDEAAAVYWQMQPLVRLFWDEQAEVLRNGGHPWSHLKYHIWAVGGNGGRLRAAAPDSHNTFPPLTPEDRQRIRETYRACGIEPSENDDEFAVGRVNYANGARPTLSASDSY